MYNIYILYNICGHIHTVVYIYIKYYMYKLYCNILCNCILHSMCTHVHKVYLLRLIVQLYILRTHTCNVCAHVYVHIYTSIYMYMCVHVPRTTYHHHVFLFLTILLRQALHPIHHHCQYLLYP